MGFPFIIATINMREPARPPHLGGNVNPMKSLQHSSSSVSSNLLLVLAAFLSSGDAI